MVQHRQSTDGRANFVNNWAWQAKFIPDIKRIIKANAGEFVNVEVGRPDEDMREATDMKIEVGRTTFAVRIRRNTKFRDLTIRAYKPNGAKTEIHKLREGFGDYYLYIWTQDDRIVEWVFVSIGMMRFWDMLDEDRPMIPNTDGTKFIAFSIAELKWNACIIAHHIE